jgi:murein DD-endopeptidase MepM/ murein hydrolase activator NlpD
MGQMLLGVNGPMTSRMALLVALVGALSVPAAAGAQTSGGDVSATIQNQITEASTQEIQALEGLATIRNQEAALNARVSDLNDQLGAAQAKLAPLQADADHITAFYNAVEAQEQVTQAKLDTAQAALNASAASLLIEAQEGNGYTSIEASPPAQAAVGEQYMHRVAQVRKTLVESVRVLRDQVDAQRRQIGTAKAQADGLLQQGQAARDQIQSLTAQLQPAQAQATQADASQQQALQSIQSRKGEFEAELNALQPVSDSIGALLRARGVEPGTVGHCDARPVPGPIISGFGPRVDPVSGAQGFHPGDDLQASSGTPIHACRAGTVVIASMQGGYGNAVVIDHGGGMATLYGHQSRLASMVGEHVNAGDVIGYVGATGYATGPHLHFEVRLSGNPVDPTSYIS